MALFIFKQKQYKKEPCLAQGSFEALEKEN
ncbi:hypothetical protein MWMV7_MWMV7_02661 [Acinetobacter calcoaceticus]|nr:hypothetical protein MWMV7_MWMV7_02661 [Acinetobacter calcoaceticus]